MITIAACAKINLTLEVLGRRSDGYHDIVTVFQEVDLKDVLCFDEDNEIMVTPSEDLVLKAARLLQHVSGCRMGASIAIKKVIPAAAGLGGSSSDAAATLIALNELWSLGLSLAELHALASRVSADSAFFLYGGTALGEGRGDRITRLPELPPSWVVLLRPQVALPQEKTASLYARLSKSHFTQGQYAAKLADCLRRGVDVSPALFFNVFDQVAFDTFPGLEHYWRHFSRLGDDSVHLAGSGPTMFCLIGDNERGDELCSSLKDAGLEAYLVHTKA